MRAVESARTIVQAGLLQSLGGQFPEHNFDGHDNAFLNIWSLPIYDIDETNEMSPIPIKEIDQMPTKFR